MYIDFKRRRNIDGDQFKLFGILGCKKCVNKWKLALQHKGRHVRIRKGVKGWEVWATK